MTTTTPGTPNSALSSAQWRQFVWITLAAVSLYVLFRFLPTGTDLNHMDFRATGKNAIEMCDPSNPQFISVIAATSPVALTVKTAAAPTAGREVQVTVRMTTANNKPIAPEDLVVMHTRKLHLLIADPSLTDYQHLHPEPTRVPGEWSFTFTPKLGGIYRIFADFTPAATNRSLYANVDLVVAGEQLSTPELAAAMTPSWIGQRDAYRLELVPGTRQIRAGQATDLKFSVTNTGGGAVGLEPVMDAYAHLVAFDTARSGFAHLHPMDADLGVAPDSIKPTLSFKITIPAAGRYVIWAQLKINGREKFVPFWFDVAA
ncbi:MAG: hypothetical protein B9S26_10215 [Opitutia bacterium Tous-C4FEB]|nr:MAG: hypothetical protein B9S35_06210 [Opitutae bacterium Tous-C5TDCM]PAW88947.1 MAG: hypothetical protein B9S26_10215 [Opitutae bacterium Tous-C4FEB]